MPSLDGGHSASKRDVPSWISFLSLGSLGQGLVGAAAVVGGAVGEEEVDDHADDGEEEDDEAPQELGAGRAVGLENLDCRDGALASC